MTTQTIKIEGMVCEHCKARVESTITAIEGVQQASVDLAAATASVVYDESKLQASAIIDAIEDAGYGATL